MRANLRSALGWSRNVLMKEITAEGRIPVVTGTLRRSFSLMPIKDIPGGFESGVGTALVYAPVVEFGFDGMVRAHVRRTRSRDVSTSLGTASTTDKLGRTRTRERRQLQATGICFVKSFHRKQRAHPYIRPGIEASIPEITQLFKDSVNAATRGEQF
jgi:hypothetical protein